MSQAIHDAAEVSRFMKSDVGKGALARIAAKYYEEFRRADSSEKRVTAWAKANALEDFLTEIQTVQDSGERETLIAARSALKPKDK